MSIVDVLERGPCLMHQKLEVANSTLNYDFCPWANRWVYWTKHPISVLSFLLISSLLCGLFVNQAAYGFAGMVLLLTILGVVWPWLSLKGVECDLEFDRHRCRVDQSVVIKILLRNRWPFPVWGMEIKKGFTLNNDDSSGIAIACLLGWSTKVVHWHFQPQVRGEFPRHEPSLETGFPFGLIRQHKRVAFNHSLLVWPKSNSLRGIPETINQASPDGRFSDRHAGDAGDLLGTRGFRQGDSLRRIHWGQTARHGRLIVTERQSSVGTVMQLVPDFRAESHHVSASFSTLETMIEAVTSIVSLLHDQHQYAECFVDGRWYRAGKSDVDYRQLMDALARLSKDGTSNDGKSYRQKRDTGMTQIHLSTPLSRCTCGPARQTGNEIILTLENPEAMWQQFSRQWRRLCHAA